MGSLSKGDPFQMPLAFLPLPSAGPSFSVSAPPSTPPRFSRLSPRVPTLPCTACCHPQPGNPQAGLCPCDQSVPGLSNPPSITSPEPAGRDLKDVVMVRKSPRATEPLSPESCLSPPAWLSVPHEVTHLDGASSMSLRHTPQPHPTHGFAELLPERVFP